MRRLILKIARGRELLTLEQRENFMKIPEEDWALGSYYTFSKEDLELINKHRRDGVIINCWTQMFRLV